MIKTTKSTIISHINYYCMIGTHRGKAVFTKLELVEYFTELVNKYCKEIDCELTDIVVYEDHVLFSVEAPASISPSSILSVIRTRTSTEIREKFADISVRSALWGRDAIVSTREIENSEIKQFVQDHKRKSGT